MRICEDISELQKAYVKFLRADQVVNPAATKLLMSKLSQQIKHVRDLNLPADVVSQSDALGMVSSALDRAVALSGTDALIVASLSSLRSDFELLAIIFGCEFAASNEVGADIKPLVIRHMPGAEQTDSGIRALGGMMFLGGSGLGVLAALAAILTRFGFRSRAKREVCNTPVLLSIKDGCTITRIVDINRNGMKIEAAPIHVQDGWVELYFCGHKRLGTVRWKNEYFAGVQFRKRISQAAVADVVEKSQSKLELSGLEKNAPPCFRFGCHEGCDKHCSSAISERAAKEREQSQQAL